MKVRILPSAINDLSEGGWFYERQGEGLGAYFMDTLFSEIDSLALYGGIHLKVLGFHRMLSKRFPFAIYYRVNDNVVEIWRVLDCRQNPRKTRAALK
jgi:plasmid stabilization system protein ParE